MWLLFKKLICLEFSILWYLSLKDQNNIEIMYWLNRIGMGHWKPGKSWNLIVGQQKIWKWNFELFLLDYVLQMSKHGQSKMDTSEVMCVDLG